MRYYVTTHGWFSAHLSSRDSETGDASVEADSPEAAIEQFYQEATPSLCHHCTDSVEIEDCLYSVVTTEDGEEVYNDIPDTPRKPHTRHALRRGDGLYYTHGHPCGSWAEFPRCQVYHSKSGATRQANKLKGSWNRNGLPVQVVEIGLVPPAAP